MNKVKIYLFLFVFSTNPGFSQEKANLLNINASYTADNLVNIYGGIKTGYNYLGFAQVNIVFNTADAKLWNGGKLLIHPASTHGGEPTSNLIGDYQGASNIEAGNHFYMHEFLYKQKIKDFSLIFGLQDLNTNFANGSIAKNFINSSFGIHSIFSENFYAPIFPLTSLGITTIWNISSNLVFLSSVFDSRANDFKNNPYNLKWQFNKEDGILTVNEMQYSIQINEKLVGTYKLGTFLETKNENKNAIKILNGDTVFEKHSDYGFYINADQIIYKNNKKEIGTFLQFGSCPEKLNHNSRFFGFGINYSGILNNSNNMVGIALARAKLISYKILHETVIEISFKTKMFKTVYLQPDFQYIINPSGTNKLLKNALLFNVRLIWEGCLYSMNLR